MKFQDTLENDEKIVGTSKRTGKENQVTNFAAKHKKAKSDVSQLQKLGSMTAND